MTVLGPIQVQQGQDPTTKLGHVFMNEHLVCDPKRKRTKSDSITTNDTYITLHNLSRIRSNPFQSEVNMTLSSMNELLDEFQLLQEADDGSGKKLVGTMLDVTTTHEGRDPISCQKVSKQLGINVVIGTTPQATDDLDNVKTMEEDISYMEKELMYGLDGYDGEADDGNDKNDNNANIIRAGFIGEITVQVDVGGQSASSSSNTARATLSSSEVYQIKACCMVSATTSAPVIIGLSPNRSEGRQQQQQRQPNNKHIVLQILDVVESCGCSLSNIILSHIDIYHYDIQLLQYVLDKGVNLGFDSYSLTYAIHDCEDIYPSLIQVVNCICTLLEHDPQYAKQIVLSCGLRMKLQYTKYGGLGYNVLYQHLLPKLRLKLSKCIISGSVEGILDTILIHIPHKLLQWWKEPPPKVKPKVYMNCSICNNPFEPIEGTYYSKYTFVYCSRPCLLTHVQRNFK